jgi:hypothetical protein
MLHCAALPQRVKVVVPARFEQELRTAPLGASASVASGEIRMALSALARELSIEGTNSDDLATGRSGNPQSRHH